MLKKCWISSVKLATVMVNEYALHKARELANSVRFSDDQHDKALGSQPASLDHVMDEFYRSAVEISPLLTPTLETSLINVCQRLNLDRHVVHAFVHNSSELQAACYYTDEIKCLIRISSALVNLLKEDQLEFVIAHEIGHFLLQHAPSGTSKKSVEFFIFQRAKEISADRIGLIGCGSLKLAADTLIKVASGLHDKFLDIKIDAYLAQMSQITNKSGGERPFETHPSMLVRAFSLNEFSDGHQFVNYDTFNVKQVYNKDIIIKNYLDEFVDKKTKEDITNAKIDLEMWIAARHIAEDGRFDQYEQTLFSQKFGETLLQKLKVFLQTTQVDQITAELDERIAGTKLRLQALSPAEFSRIEPLIISDMAKKFGRNID